MKPWTKGELIDYLKSKYKRFTIVEYNNNFSIQFKLPGKIIPFDVGYTLESRRPAGILFVATRLRWYENWFKKIKIIVK